ncbi:MAG: cytochrome c3 family protein [Bacteroidota bacterium]
MKYYIVCFLFFLFFDFSERINAQIQYQSSMLETKHNLGITGTGTIKASTEKQVCVFCHTPHVPKEFASAELWNHKSNNTNYTLYSSEYLTSLDYTLPNQPKSRSKLCLSCHDGTIAIGAVYNNNGSTIIQMQNGITTMPLSSSGNIGTSLTNDHPIGYIFDAAKDNELISRSWPWQTPVKLDPDATNGTLECHSCHEPHSNINAPFLRVPNENAALCTFCHNKTGWSGSVHKISTQSFTPQGGSATTVGEWACRSCHKTHGGEGTPYIMTLVEQNTCYNEGCHGATLTGTNTKNIQSEMNKLYSHPTNTVNNKHKNPDNATSLGISNRHAECQDCHNAHQATKEVHAIGNNSVSGVLSGVKGVVPEYIGIWRQPTTFTIVNPSSQENQICFKCHSYYAFGDAPNGVTNIIGPSGINITDQAMEFNYENRAAHPVLFSSKEQSGALEPRGLNSMQMNENWFNTGGQTMYCSDCHGNDEQPSSIMPQGSHGSNAKFMLTGNAKFWPTNSSAILWSLDNVKNNSNWQSELFCSNCHSMYNGISFMNNVHDNPNHQSEEIKCITCHVAVPHGSKRSRLIGYLTDSAPYNYLGEGPLDRLVIDGFRKASNFDLYEKKDCSMKEVCHGVQIGEYED